MQSTITNWVRISGPGAGLPGTCVAQVGGLDRGQAYRWVPFDCNDARPFICTHIGINNKIAAVLLFLNKYARSTLTFV